MSVEGCTVIGHGAKGTIWRVSPDTILKVYEDRDALAAIRHEREMARTAFILGIPTAISFDVVKVGDRYASMFELLDCRTLSQLIAEDPSQMERYARIFTDLLLQVHSTHVDTKALPDLCGRILSWNDACYPWLSREERHRLSALHASLPVCDTMLHGDYHTNNVLLQDGKPMLIDMDTLGYGHPIFELAQIYITYVGFELKAPGTVESFIGLSTPLAVRFWDLFLHMYLEGQDERSVQRVQDRCELLAMLRLVSHITRRGLEATPQGEAGLRKALERIHALLPQIATLDLPRT